MTRLGFAEKIGAGLLCAVCLLLLPAPASAGLLDRVGASIKAATDALPEPVDAAGPARAAPGVPVATAGQIPGAELVITSVRPTSLEDARAHRIGVVHDGDPVYLYLKLPRPVENYVFVWNLSGSSEYADRKAIGIQINPVDHPEDAPAVMEENFLPTDKELKATELVIEMAPGELRPISVYGWLRLVGGGRPGTWANEFRIYSRDTNSLTTTILARAPLTASVEGGVAKYKAQLEAFKRRQEAGDAAFNTIPSRGEAKDPVAEKKAAELAAKTLGVKFTTFYLTGTVWWENRNAIGQLEKHNTSALGLYRSGAKCMAAIVNVNRWVPNQNVTAEVTKTFEIACDKAAAAR